MAKGKKNTEESSDNENTEIKSIKITGKPEDADLTEYSREDLESMFKASISALQQMAEETNKMRSSYELSMKKGEQEIEMNAHEVEKRKLVTLFDVITNTKELLVQRINEHGKAELQHTVDSGTQTAANNLIKSCLKQAFIWVDKNNINKPKLKTNEKTTEKQGDFDDSVDITVKDLFPTK